MKLYLYLKQGENTFTFGEKNLMTISGQRMEISKVTAFWRCENVFDDTTVYLVDKNGVTTLVHFGEGYYTFANIRKIMEEEGVIILPNDYNGTCRISAGEYSVNMGEIGTLLGLPANTTISRGLTKETGKVNINKGLSYFTLSCNIVDDQKVTNRFGSPSEVLGMFPIDTSQVLFGTFTNFGQDTFSAPVVNGSFRNIKFTIRDNLPRNLLKLHLFCECEIK